MLHKFQPTVNFQGLASTRDFQNLDLSQSRFSIFACHQKWPYLVESNQQIIMEMTEGWKSKEEVHGGREDRKSVHHVIVTWWT